MGVNLMLQSDLRTITEAIDQTTGIGYVELLAKRRSSTRRWQKLPYVIFCTNGAIPALLSLRP